MKKVTKAVFPVAGLGSRFLPVTKASPKEMLPIVDKPLIQYAVEEASAAGITQMIFITGRSKRSIADHFDRAPELEAELAAKGKFELLELVRNISPETESFVYMLTNGGKAIKHLQRTDEALPFLTPAIIDTTGMAERPDVELFGPILQVIRVDEFDAAIAEANNTRFGLCASLIGGDPQEYNRFWANIRAGIINWNRPTTGAPLSAPFGGIGLSGNHRPTGFYAADYSAYPVTSAEMEQPRANIGAGFREST